MNTIEAITEILKREGVEYLPCFPTTPVIEAAALGGIRPIVCRQERVGVGIADGIGWSAMDVGAGIADFVCRSAMDHDEANTL